jgi:hypothetical protein
MLVSLQAMAADAAVNWHPFSTGEATAEAISTRLRPEDPSTLTLALIGAATLAVYLAARRGARDRTALRIEALKASAAQAPVTVGIEAAATKDAEQPSRGAA